jgi:tetratricopeptide (TPR) repeat protein
MKKGTRLGFLLLAVISLGRGTAFGTGPDRAGANSPAAAGSPAQAAAPANQKVIKDPAEYDAYITALKTSAPKEKAAAMESFLKQYPDSVMKVDALEQAMGAYQQAGDAAKIEDSANRIIALKPDHIQALAILTYLRRAKASQGDPAALAAMRQSAAKGVELVPNWKPEGVPPEQAEKLRSQLADIFYGASGFAALQAKDYAAARDSYQKAVAIDPTNPQDVYQLSISDLEMNPMDVTGFWYAAKAAQLLQGNPSAQANVSHYTQAKYRKYHGGDDGWDQIAAGVAAQSAPSADFAQSLKRAPTPAELAVKAVQENDVATLSFSDWEFILSYRDASPANHDAADKVWAALDNKQSHGAAKLQFKVTVVAATKDSLDVAVTEDNQKANKADLRVTMEKPLASPPAVGASVNLAGVITSYAPQPFLFLMEQGELAGKK